jgi:hypothetical protein
VPIEFKVIDENEEVIYVFQQRPLAQRKGMPQYPLQNYNSNNQCLNSQNTSLSGNISCQKP